MHVIQYFFLKIYLTDNTLTVYSYFSPISLYQTSVMFLFAAINESFATAVVSL